MRVLLAALCVAAVAGFGSPVAKDTGSSCTWVPGECDSSRLGDPSKVYTEDRAGCEQHCKDHGAKCCRTEMGRADRPNGPFGCFAHSGVEVEDGRDFYCLM